MVSQRIRRRFEKEGRDFSDAMSATPDPDLAAQVVATFGSTDDVGDLPRRDDGGPGQGVVQCDDVCPSCGGQCRWAVEHRGSYGHECMDGHQWDDGSDDGEASESEDEQDASR